ncbi:acetate kinase [Actinobacillus equuli]|nr:acetate kinase [Actinobacillus equuli]
MTSTLQSFLPIQKLRYVNGANRRYISEKSGLLGLTEVTSDCRYAEDNYDDASKPEAKRALDVYSYRLANISVHIWQS